MSRQKLEYLSHSGWNLFERDPEQWVLKYLTDAPRLPQTPPMAIGSAFDVRVKDAIRKRLKVSGPELSSEMERGVESHVRDEARSESERLFKYYHETGTFDELLREMEGRIYGPILENDFIVEIKGQIEPEGPVLGFLTRVKLDLGYINKGGEFVVHDWKVNGWYGQKPTSPAKGYVARTTARGDVKGQHKDAFVYKGTNQGKIEDNQRSWAEQLTLYAWALGTPVCDTNFRISVDQVCGNKDQPEFAKHRYKGSSIEFQRQLFEQFYWAFVYIQKGHYFRELEFEESVEKTKKLLEPDGYLFY